MIAIRRYGIPSSTDRRTTAHVVLTTLLARGARPLVFTRTTADAAVLASSFGLLLLAPASAERTFAHIRSDSPPGGLVATLANVSGWRAEWATDVLFVDPPTRVELAQGVARVARPSRTGELMVGIVYTPQDTVSQLLTG
jgi:hypothetical protein